MITLEIADSIATLTLRHPPVNAISDRLIELFEDRLDDIDAQPDCKVVHLRSDQRIFCAGADLTEIRQRFDAPDGPERAHRFVSQLQQLYDRIERLPQVTMAEIAGAAMGGGLELALACDLRIIATDGRVGLPEISLGLIPAGGDAVQLGLAQWAAAPDDIASRASAIVGRIATFPTAALRGSKKCIAAAGDPDGRGYASEREVTQRLSTHPETRDRVAAFLASHSR